jgi:hypothetical protein
MISESSRTRPERSRATSEGLFWRGPRVLRRRQRDLVGCVTCRADNRCALMFVHYRPLLTIRAFLLSIFFLPFDGVHFVFVYDFSRGAPQKCHHRKWSRRRSQPALETSRATLEGSRKASESSRKASESSRKASESSWTTSESSQMTYESCREA